MYVELFKDTMGITLREQKIMFGAGNTGSEKNYVSS